MADARYWIDRLALQRHPEGGWYAESYRAGDVIAHLALPERFTGPRPVSTGIYFLLEGTDVSHFHRLTADELWHFYAGTGVLLHLLSEHNGYGAVRLGSDPERGELPQAVVPHGTWMAAEMPHAAGYALMGCTVAPGFVFDDFILAKREPLCIAFPDHRTLIERLTLP